MTPPARARAPRRSRGSNRARNVRSRGAAVLLVVLGAFLGWAVPRWEQHLPSTGLGFDASTAQATLAAIAGGMITLAGFIVTAITLVIQTVQSMSPRLVSALGHFSRYLVLFGLLIGTALYALVALSQVQNDLVPRGSVTLAVGLVLVDSVVVLRLLASLRHAVTGGGLSRGVAERLRTVIDQTYPPGPAVPVPPTADDTHRGARVPVVHGGGRPSCSPSTSRGWYGSPPATVCGSASSARSGTSRGPVPRSRSWSRWAAGAVWTSAGRRASPPVSGTAPAAPWSRTPRTGSGCWPTSRSGRSHRP